MHKQAEPLPDGLAAIRLVVEPSVRRQHPTDHQNIDTLTLDNAVVDIVAAGYDAAIRLGEVIERDMVALRLGPELRQVPVAAPSYLAVYWPPATPHDLLAHNCIRRRWPGHERPCAWEFCKEGRWFDVEVSGSLIASSREFGVRAAV